METYLHRVLGIYVTRIEADAAATQLIAHGMSPENVKILEPGRNNENDNNSTNAGAEAKADSDDVLKEMLREGTIGTAVGTLAGAAGTVAMAAVNISLFMASPVLGALTMLGWGAGLGGIVGATMGAKNSKGDVADLVKDALASGHVVLVAHTATEEETSYAQQIIGESTAEPTGKPGAVGVTPATS
ncbi:MAG: hypothetical protein ACOH2K_10880 [Burkholderiaceae bacterium]